MIINKFVFPIKADLKFVEGGIPQGYLTANDINKDMFYVISPAVGDTIVSANFQNNVLNGEPVKVEFTPSSLKVSELVNENESYYELVKDWNVWQGFMPSKPLEYVAYNRAGEIGISFNFKQLLVPAIPHGLEVKGFVEQEDFVPTQDGVYVVMVAYYEYDNMEFTYHDLLIKDGNDVIRKGAMTQSGNTGSVEYAVDPSVYGSEYESLDPSLTESILTKLGENSADIKLLSLKFNNYYTIEEVDGLILDTQEFTYDRNTIDNKDANTLQEAKDYTYSQVEIDNKDTAIMNKANSLEDANMLKDVSYNNVNGVLTFTRYDDTTKEIDLPLEFLVESGYYDEVANELVLVLANGSEIRIPVGNLLTDLDAHNIRFNGSGTNYLVNKNDVESAVKELDTQVALKVNTSDIVNDLVSTDTDKPLSANQGKVLNDTTAKLAESNVFTQPQQVPNATLPQHTTNLSQVETMFEMFKQQLRGYNLAMPDLEGKEYLGDGWYELYNHSTRGNVEYNVYSGEFYINKLTTEWVYLFKFINYFEPNETYTVKWHDLDFIDMNYSIQMYYEYTQLNGINLRVIYYGDSYMLNSNSIFSSVQSQMGLYSNRDYTFRGKLQIEKGDTATSYQVFYIPALKIYFKGTNQVEYINPYKEQIIEIDDINNVNNI